MNRGRITAVLFVIIFLLVMALSVNLLMDLQDSKKEAEDFREQTQVQETPETAPETPAAQTPQPTPEATPEPAPVPTADPYYDETPAPLPSLVPIPTPAPAVEGDYIDSGVFKSETGVPLDLRAEWQAEVLDENRILVTVDVILESYQIHVTQATRSVNVSVGESYTSADSPSIDWDNNAKLETLLATTAHTLDLPVGYSADFPLQVEYYFGGVYSKVELPVIECGGTITISR